MYAAFFITFFCLMAFHSHDCTTTYLHILSGKFRLLLVFYYCKYYSSGNSFTASVWLNAGFPKVTISQSEITGF